MKTGYWMGEGSQKWEPTKLTLESRQEAEEFLAQLQEQRYMPVELKSYSIQTIELDDNFPFYKAPLFKKKGAQ
jgi:hypothetical protein